jgi:hypothetical protein
MGINFTLSLLTKVLSRSILMLFHLPLIYGIVIFAIIALTISVIFAVKVHHDESQQKIKRYKLEHNRYFDYPKL